jgi:hypothetical protein
MNTHGIAGQSWQFVAAKDLKAIALPLAGGWVSGDPCGWPPIEALESGYKVGDRIYLQEDWDYFLDKFDRELCYPLKRTSPMYPSGWNPAETMPPEAAQYWYEVKKVRVMQAKDVAILSTSFSSGHSSPILILEEWAKYWNAAYPEQAWDGDLPVVVLDVEAIAG